MSLSEKIQLLRKGQNLSQEQLAEKLGISRQSVSKWESEQSVPELDKIVQISEIFNVSTDYLLKDSVKKELQKCEHIQEEFNWRKTAGNTITAIGTGVNSIGLVACAIVWYLWQTPLAYGIGLIIQIISCTFFETAKNSLDNKNKRIANRNFYSINIWLILPIPLIIVTTLVFRFFARPFQGILPTLFLLISYIIITLFSLYIIKKKF